ncbi:MAG: cytochrome c nitrite reductase small subunit [Spirochaetes bacterium]|nr:cytochrome c nitrite reductase small subunit [Spirochaetota bacterium]
MLHSGMHTFTAYRRVRSFLIIAAVITCGIGCYAVYVSRAWSYVSDDPATCVNCHIMGPQYATWSHSSHRERAHCNDCHVPQHSLIDHYAFKAKDGTRHAAIFTLRAEPQVIHIRSEGRHVVEENCIRCHRHAVNSLMEYAKNNVKDRRGCVSCHREVPHGRVNSLASAPYARVPVPESPVPAWLSDMMKNEKVRK